MTLRTPCSGQRGPWGAGPRARLTFRAGGPRLWVGTSYSWAGRVGEEACVGLGTVKRAWGREKDRVTHVFQHSELAPTSQPSQRLPTDCNSPEIPGPFSSIATSAYRIPTGSKGTFLDAGFQVKGSQFKNAQCFSENVGSRWKTTSTERLRNAVSKGLGNQKEILV